MKAVLFSLVLLAGLLYANAVQAADTPVNALLALSKHDSTLSIVDPSTLKIIAQIPVGNDPHEVIASADGHTAYVSNYGSGAFNLLCRRIVAADRLCGFGGEPHFAPDEG